MRKLLLLLAVIFTASISAQTYYVAGEGNKDANGSFCNGKTWEPNGSMMAGTNPATITFNNVAAGTYQFKVTEGNWGSPSYGGAAYTGTVVPGINKDGDNMKFTIPTSSDITITFDGASKKITGLTSSNGFGTSGTSGPITVSLKKSAIWSNPVHIHFWDGGTTAPANPVPMTLDGDWYRYTFPAGATDFNIVLVNGSNWNGDDNQTVDLKEITKSICYELVVGSGKKQVSEVACSVSNEPSVAFSNLPSKIIVNNAVILSATSSNVTNPVYTFSVKAPGASNYQTVTSPYQPNVIGSYSFRVQVVSSSDPGNILAENAVTVNVIAEPAPITISVKLPEGWSSVSLWNWHEGNPGSFVTATPDRSWYRYTFTGLEKVNFIFVNGSEWPQQDQNPTEESEKVRLGKQTVNIDNITQSLCYEIGEATWEGDNWGKRTVTSVACETVGINQTNAGEVSVLAGKGSINAFFEGAATIQLYSVTGTLLKETAVVHSFEQTGLAPGFYIVKINGKASKVLVK